MSRIGDKLSAVTAVNPTSVPALVSTHTTPLDRKDYPNVPIWTHTEILNAAKTEKKQNGLASMEDSKSLRGPSRLAETNENVMLKFVTDERGSPVDGGRAREIKKRARAIWNHLHTINKAPAVWSAADAQARDYFACEMETAFPELRLCESSCKAHRVATLIYAGWNPPPPDKSLKDKPDIDDSNALKALAPTKNKGKRKASASVSGVDEPAQDIELSSRAPTPAPTPDTVPALPPAASTLALAAAVPGLSAPAPASVPADTSHRIPSTTPAAPAARASVGKIPFYLQRFAWHCDLRTGCNPLSLWIATSHKRLEVVAGNRCGLQPLETGGKACNGLEAVGGSGVGETLGRMCRSQRINQYNVCVRTCPRLQCQPHRTLHAEPGI